MSLKSVPYYWLECDDCGAKSTEYGDYTAWSDHGEARDEATGEGWFCEEGHDWCGRCREKHTCSECDKITDELVPLDGDFREDGRPYWPVCAECKAADQ